MSIFDNELDIINNSIKTEISSFIEKNYICSYHISDRPNKKGLYEVSASSSVYVINSNIKFLTNKLFIWTDIYMNFDCSDCDLISLKGAPKNVNGNFDCSNCKNLISIKHKPKKIRGVLNYSGCIKIKI